MIGEKFEARERYRTGEESELTSWHNEIFAFDLSPSIIVAIERNDAVASDLSSSLFGDEQSPMQEIDYKISFTFYFVNRSDSAVQNVVSLFLFLSLSLSRARARSAPESFIATGCI